MTAATDPRHPSPIICALVSLLLAALLAGAGPARPESPAAGGETEADTRTRYELLAPETSQFRILYDVTATSAGASAYFNPIRKGSEASRESVIDRGSGEPLQFDVVTGDAARRGGLADADPGTRYIRVTLPRPVPAGGGIRLRIDKTYKDAASYFLEGGDIVFRRSLGVPRNTVVLPLGWELVSCNVPAQVLSEPDRRIAVSFVNANPDPVSVVIRARRLEP